MWISPDNKIKKEILESGVGSKPTEKCNCTIEITDIKFQNEYFLSEYLLEFDEYPLNIIIGEANTLVDREIDKVLQTMFLNEIASLTINLPNENTVTFNLKLCYFESNGLIYEWNAKEKLEMAIKHKEKGIELFKQERYEDASHRFSKGLKLLLSIPIPIDELPDEIDGFKRGEIEHFKSNLYNNLASCNSKVKRFDKVIDLCDKVLEIEENNVKALYKRGFAYAETRDFGKARNDLMKVLELDAGNKAARSTLIFVNVNIHEQEAKFVTMLQKMFQH